MTRFCLRWLTPAVTTVALLFTLHAQPAQAADGGQTVSGTVNDKDGKPAKDMKVSLFKASDMPAGGRRSAAPAEAPKPDAKIADAGADAGRKMPTPVGEATTDEKGGFSIKNVAPGDYALTAGDRTSEAGTARGKVTVVAGADPAPVTLSLRKRQPRGAAGGAGGAGGAGNPPPAEKK